MRRFILATTVISITAFAVAAAAQPRALRRRRGPPPKTAPPARGSSAKPAPPARGKPAPDMGKVCRARRSILTQEEQRGDRFQANLVGIDVEIVQLRRQLDELNRKRRDTKKLVDTYNIRIAKADKAYKKDCAKNTNCDQYDTLADSLDGQSQNVETQLGGVRIDIDRTRRDIDVLRGRIDPLRREYHNLRCNNMVPGETAQSTIDRCSSIFSEWNRLQSDLNRHNRALPILKSRYEQLLAELRTIESRARGYEDYMTRNCQSSSKVVVMHNHSQGSVRKRAESLGRELDKLIEDVTKLRGVRITVAPR
ncbi:MAG: hypothetical protein V3T05_08210 [Myxococcota bacterium]